MINQRITPFLAAACCLLLASCAGDTTVGTGPLPTLTHDPILFVHGYAGNNGNWQDMKAKFRADGWQDVELYAYNYSFVNSNASSAAEIRDQIDRIITSTGATRVDIVAFSMGSVSSRYYLKNLGGAAKVDAWVSLAGPNHGTDAVENEACTFTPCKEIIPGSTFLTALNAVDETPGLARYATFWSACDQTINPDLSVILTGATNTQVGCIQHIEFLTNDDVYRRVRNFVQ
ncbi:MAG: alpha/beta fold hydrolase [Gemmatimonadaceae bacterium]